MVLVSSFVRLHPFFRSVLQITSFKTLLRFSLTATNRCFRMHSVWFENLVVDAMASETSCLLKANLSGDMWS